MVSEVWRTPRGSSASPGIQDVRRSQIPFLNHDAQLSLPQTQAHIANEWTRLNHCARERPLSLALQT